MRNAKLLVLNIVLLFGVVKGYGTPTASFTADQTSGCAPFAVTFTSTSTGATTYYWTFGNGNSSTLPNPSNTYTSPGQYTVTLAVSDATGNTNTATYTNYINVVDYPNAGFYSSSTAACPGLPAPKAFCKSVILMRAEREVLTKIASGRIRAN